MRMSTTHKVAVTAVAATIATATVLTFSRADTAPADRIAGLPETSNDAPVVAPRSPDATTKPTPKPKPSPETTQPAPQAPKPAATSDKPSTPTTKPPKPPTTPAPSPSPTPKSLLDILLGK